MIVSPGNGLDSLFKEVEHKVADPVDLVQIHFGPPAQNGPENG